MLQDPVVAKHPDHNLGMLSCSRAAATIDRSQKSNPHQPEQPLNCPRCDSTNTKFCYYNNYSLAQPRHFCKNCRRYWTKGGALRNVPIGGGCRKNKRIKQRALDPSSLVGSVLDETTSNMLASINRAGSCSSFMASLSPSTPGLLDLSNESHGFGLTLSRLQESLRLKEQSGAVRSDLGVYDLGIGNSQAATELLSGSSCSQASLISSLSPSFNTNFLGFRSSMVKQEQGALYSTPDLCPLFEAHPDMANPTVATSSALEQFSPYNAPAESFNGEAHEQNNLTLQLVHDDQVDRDQGHFFPAVAEETKEYLRNVKGKPIMSSFPDQWQGMHDNYYETGAVDSHYMWMNNNIGWPEFQTVASSGGGGIL